MNKDGFISIDQKIPEKDGYYNVSILLGDKRRLKAECFWINQDKIWWSKEGITGAVGVEAWQPSSFREP